MINREGRPIDWKRDNCRAEKALVRSLMDCIVEVIDRGVFLGDTRTGQVRTSGSTIGRVAQLVRAAAC